MTPASCCPPAADTHHGTNLCCPKCDRRATAVSVRTVKALLTERAMRRFAPGAYGFCGNAGCDVVYFDAGGATFATGDVRVPVWQKECFGKRTICYCFDENEAALQEELEEQTVSRAVERICQHIATGRCACDVRNPRGSCCLGDVTAAVERVSLMVQASRVRP